MIVYEAKLNDELMEKLISMSAEWEAENSTYGYRKNDRSDIEENRIFLAERDGEIVGYAYAGAFHPRAAYDWAVESTVYVQEDQEKTGVGRKLYEALEQALVLQNILNVYACIAYPEVEDEYLNKNSA